MKYVLAILVLSLVIIIHEFGHFIVAKASGVKVVEFSLGMGPRLIKFTRKGTMYSIKLFLFGGSCQMLGDNTEEEGEGSFNSVSVWKRIAIIAAGPIFNFILAFIFAVFLIGKMGYNPVVLYDVKEGTPAYEAGLQAGDTIIKINGKKMNFYGDYTLYMYDHQGATLNITYKRDGNTYRTTVTPKHITDNVYQLGIYTSQNDKTIISDIVSGGPADKSGVKADDVILSINGISVSKQADISPAVQTSNGEEIEVVVDRNGEQLTVKLTPESVKQNYYEYGYSMANVWVKCSPSGTIKYSFKEVGYWIKAVFKSLGMLVTGNVKLDDLSGPVGIVSAIGDVVEESKTDGALYILMNLINWCIMISANLGVMNLLPIPAVDGGRLVFLFIEAIRKKPVPREKEGMVHFVGIILLMILMVVVLFNDISKFFR